MLNSLECHAALGPTYAARLLGVAYPTYAQYRSGRRALPLYHHRHIETLIALDHEMLLEFIKEYANGNRN